MCADCGHSLDGAENINETELDAAIKKAGGYSDPFAFKPRHQVIFYASLLLLLADIVIFILSAANILPSVNFKAVSASALLCILCVYIARFPKVQWSIEKFFIEFKVSGDIEPSDWWFIGREIALFGIFIINVTVFLFGAVII